MKYSPGNDPFVITVGAVDLGGSFRVGDDSVAPFSAYGYTYDGFYKPEIAAPGRYMVGPIPPTGAITTLKPVNMVGKDRIQLSGTSFAAPVVSGTVAQMLARNPSWTPDQVKGALMRTARKVPNNPKAAGVGEVTVTRAVSSYYTPNPNKGLEKFVSTDLTTGLTNFDASGWSAKAKSDMSWNSMSWADSQSWSDMSWADQSWASMSWADQSWSDMSWADMSWADMSWADVSQEDAAEGDAATGEDGTSRPRRTRPRPRPTRTSRSRSIRPSRRRSCRPWRFPLRRRSCPSDDQSQDAEGPRERALGRFGHVPRRGELRPVARKGDEGVRAAAVTSCSARTAAPRDGAEGDP